MIITNLPGQSELLVDYIGLKRVRKVNSEYSLSFSILKTEKSQYGYDYVNEESMISYDGQDYRIKEVQETLVGVTPMKTVQAYHVFFDLVDSFRYAYLTGVQSMFAAVAFALENTGYTFEIVDSFEGVEFEKFGEDTALSLIQTVLDSYRAEVKINNKHLTFMRQIGVETEIQIRYGYNVKTLERTVNTNNLSTRIRGFGKKDEQGNYLVEAEFISPLAIAFGIRDAKPVYDERFTNRAALMIKLENEIVDTPEISFKVDALELSKIGVLTDQLNEGDTVYVIYEPLNIDITARVIEIVDYPETSQPAEYTFGNFKNTFTSQVASFQKTKDNLDSILNGERKLPYNVLDDAVLRATEALNSAATELVFDNGIIARDPSNPNNLVLLNSKGIGISRNGGATFTEAITANGFVLSAGAIGTLAANNITVGPSTTFENGYNPKVVDDQLQLWRYPNTTSINGGSIFTNTISVNSLQTGLLTGFGIQTQASQFLPRIYMSGGMFRASNNSNQIIMDTEQWDSYAGLIVQSGDTNARIQSFDGRNVFSSNAAPLELFSIDGVSVSTDFTVAGSKNASVPTSIGMVNISAYETAEYYFGDIGRGETVDGQCKIEIEKLFAETVNTSIDYEVFLTPYGKGLIYVDEMNKDFFVVKGDNIKFSYEIKAKRVGYEDVRLELSKASEVKDFVQDVIEE